MTSKFEKLVEYLRAELKYQNAWRPSYDTTTEDEDRNEGRIRALEEALAEADSLGREESNE